MSMSDDFRAFTDTVSSALVATTRAAGQISSEDLAFHRTSNPSIGTQLDRQNTRLLKLVHGLTKAATQGTEVKTPHFADPDSVEDNWKSLVEVFDNLLENADACLDEFTGSIKRPNPSQEDQIKKAAPAKEKHRHGRFNHAQDIIKPQTLFEDVPRNNEKAPFRPLLQKKPHALVPLEESFGLLDSEDGSKQYQHPYGLEIRTARYPPSTFVKSEPVPYLSFNDTKATFVDTLEAVDAMLADLKQAKEIAVDLEHHDEHSYAGLVSLMQISTRTKDWIVDTLKPWRKGLQVLNEVFTDPNILKVLHGAFMDVIWLQRDLGLYVVNLFDTFHASRALGYPQKSLAYLLKTFANVDAAKQYQMADWRVRPLPEEMFDYARSDTHYLLYIFDNMRNALIEGAGPANSGENLLEKVMNKSKEVALQRYERHIYDFQRGSGPAGWYNMLCRTPALFTYEQFSVFRKVHQWRDGVARDEDESVQVVMPKHVLYNIAREIPVDIPTLLGCSHPMSKVFQKRKEELLEIIKRAKVLGTAGPDMKELMQEIDTLLYQSSNVMKGVDTVSANGVKSDTKFVRTTQQTEVMLPLRSDRSSFWGPSISRARRFGPNNDWQVHFLALPLPSLTAEIFEENGHASNSRNIRAESRPGVLIEKQSVNDKLSRSDTFVLKNDGGSRKRKLVIPGGKTTLLTGEDSPAALRQVTDDFQDQSSETEQSERKAEKRRLKKAKTDEASQYVIPGDEAPEAFDYANAASILHPKQTGAGRTMTGNQGCNPYAKSIDAPKSMRKRKKEISGKSHTFKS